PVPRRRASGGARPLRAPGRARLGPGGAPEHGGLAIRARALPGRRRSRRTARALRGPRGQRLSGAGLAQGARGRAGGAARGRAQRLTSGAPARKSMAKVLVLSHAEVEELLPMDACIGLMAEALTELARGRAEQPLRTVFRPENAAGLLALMPAFRAGKAPAIGVKAIGIFPGNVEKGKDSHQ